MTNIVVTSGFAFTDIDALACALGYSQLLNMEGKKSCAVISGAFNKSVTREVKAWDLLYQTQLPPQESSYVLVDLSNPEYVAGFVDQKGIAEVYDHHFGFEEYWKERLGDKAKIEKVGSCATLIWEEYKKRGYQNSISTVNANLLYTAIISNTLNFKSGLTSQRDISAFKQLEQFTQLPDDWTALYFSRQEEAVLADPKQELLNDTHVESFPQSKERLVIAQIELWDSSKFIQKHSEDIQKALETHGTRQWFLTSPSINEGINYIYCISPKVKDLLSEKLGVVFRGNLAKTDKLLLRKEIKKILYSY